MKCPYCDTEFEVDTLAEYGKELESDMSDSMEWENVSDEWTADEAEGLCSYVCKSCGGEIIGDRLTAATTCPFCGNHVVMLSNLSGSQRPELVIPFKLDKAAAKAGLLKHLSGKRLLPKIFKDENHIDEIKGVYVPFWLFDTDAQARVRYRATRVRFYSDSKYDYTETSHFLVSRGGSMGFEHVPVDGSTKIADDLTESLEPFDISEAVDFKTAYLAGFFADKYDVDSEKSAERANERIKHSVEEAFAATVNGYASVIPEETGIKLDSARFRYALYPIWLLNTTWNGKQYTFAMNGQTGKFVGDLPVDKSAARKWLLGLTAAVGVGVYALILLLHAVGML